MAGRVHWKKKLRVPRRPSPEGQAANNMERVRKPSIYCVYFSCVRVILLHEATVETDLILAVFSPLPGSVRRSANSLEKQLHITFVIKS